MEMIPVTRGVSLVRIPEARLSILCGCPENAIKHLFKRGLIEKAGGDGRSYETGPNAILLSEVAVQNGRFANLAEFPVLHMLYRQGMIIPGHPGNTGLRPMLIGMPEQLEAVSKYIYAGNYGITDPGELSPEDPALAESLMKVKRWFAFGQFRQSDELLELKRIDGTILELRDGAFLRRLGVNRYEIIHGSQSVLVDLGLKTGQDYECPYSLPSLPASREGFAVIHLGEGDGWDPERPCMSSIVMNRGEAYLIDAGPNIEQSLEAVGLAVGCLKGIFQTHVHDDHFVGLTALMRSERRLSYYAVPTVRRSAQRKLEALSGIGERDFKLLFDARDLEAGAWNDIDGMEVLPRYSPHPLETTTFCFRSAGADGTRRSYAHGADLSSFSILDAMTDESSRPAALSAEEAETIKREYLEPADIKKVDVGGGQIHGDAADFSRDASEELLLSHGIRSSVAARLGFGRVARFGEKRVFLPLDGTWYARNALSALRAYFPGAAEKDLRILLDQPFRAFSAKDTLCRAGDTPDSVFLSIDGKLEILDAAGTTVNVLRAGALVNALECVSGKPVFSAVRAGAETRVLVMAAERFLSFVRSNELENDFREVYAAYRALASCDAFKALEFLPGLITAARSARRMSFPAGSTMDGGEYFYVVASGRIAVFGGRELVEFIGPGEGCGEDGIWGIGAGLFRQRAFDDVEAYAVPIRELMDKPLILWRLRERFAQRLAVARESPALRWRAEFAMGRPDIDEEHFRIFCAMDDLEDEGQEGLDAAVTARELAAAHFSREEETMRRSGYPEHLEHAAEHASFLAVMDGAIRRVGAGEDRAALSFELKDALIRHTLVADRRYLPWLRKS